MSGLHYLWVGCRMSVLLSGEWNSWGVSVEHKHLWISFELCTTVARLTPTYLPALSLKKASHFAVVCMYALLKFLFFLVLYQVLILRGLKLQAQMTACAVKVTWGRSSNMLFTLCLCSAVEAKRGPGKTVVLLWGMQTCVCAIGWVVHIEPPIFF